MKLLIIIDMLNGFCSKENPLSLANSTLQIENVIEKLILDYKKNNHKVIFICDSHSLTDVEINNPYPAHCLANSKEAEIIDSLKKYGNSENTITKNTLSIILNTQLLERLETIKPTEIEVTGVCTDICVLFAVYELKIRGYNVVVNSKGVMPLKTENQDFFLNYMDELLNAEIK